MAVPNPKIDRQTTTPFHLKLFYRTGSFHRLDEFPSTPSTPLPSHLQIYTWPTCTLRELSHLLVTALPSLLPSPSIGTRLAYRLIFPDTRSTTSPGRYISKELGSVVVGGDGEGGGVFPSDEEEKVVAEGVMSGRLGGEPDKTLQEARFVVGDWVCCAVFEVGGDGSVSAAPRVVGRGEVAYGRGVGAGGGYGGGRENGFGGGYRGRGRGRGGLYEGRLGGEGVPSGEWRRGERVPDGGRGYGRGRGRGY